MKSLLFCGIGIACGLFCTSVKGQVKDSARQNMLKQSTKPEILSAGFIDIVNNGQVNASARFIRLFIGEPGRFSIPLSVYSGVSSNNFQNPQMQPGLRSNEHLLNNFLNPLSGIINFTVEGIPGFSKKIKLTKLGILYHSGIRVLTGYKIGLITDPTTGRPVNFINLYACSGIFFQTGAWERNNAKNMGIFWIAARYIVTQSDKKHLLIILPDTGQAGFYQGISVGGGVEINGLVNIKLVHYKYLPAAPLTLSAPIYQFSFNYSLRN